MEEKQKRKLLKIERGRKKLNEPENKEIKEVKLKLKVAEDSINEGNMKLKKALKESKLSRKDIQDAQSLIDMGIEHKCNVEEEIKKLDNKK